MQTASTEKKKEKIFLSTFWSGKFDLSQFVIGLKEIRRHYLLELIMISS